MLIFLLLFEVAIIFIVVLCHIMIERKYKEIENSTRIYTNKRAYRTQKSVAFIENVLKRYQQYASEQGEEPDLYSMIKCNLLREYIGKFTFIGVNNVANKAKYIMWGIIALELTIAVINNIATSLEGIIVIVSSILLAIGVEIFTIIRALEEKKEAIIVLIEDYILNTYPIQINKVEKVLDVKREKELPKGQARDVSLSVGIEQENVNDRFREERKKDLRSPNKERLTEKDIAGFIRNLNKLS